MRYAVSSCHTAENNRRVTRVDSSLWPQRTVPKLPSGTNGCQTLKTATLNTSYFCQKRPLCQPPPSPTPPPNSHFVRKVKLRLAYRLAFVITASSDTSWHATSQLITVAHPTSPHNQPHYFISPRKQLQNIKTGHITTMEQQKARSKQLVWDALVGRLAHILQANSFFAIYKYIYIYIHIFSFLFCWNFRPRLARELLVYLPIFGWFWW